EESSARAAKQLSLGEQERRRKDDDQQLDSRAGWSPSLRALRIAPPRLRGVTGVPVNPLAIF
ncbi:MAG TPA: hypothetical protein VGE11_12300, partial [Pseudonocardia sp.]